MCVDMCTHIKHLGGTDLADEIHSIHSDGLRVLCIQDQLDRNNIRATDLADQHSLFRFKCSASKADIPAHCAIHSADN